MARSFTFVVTDPNGLHARPASELVDKAQACQSQVTVGLGESVADAKSILGIMGLGVKCGDMLTVRVEGKDEESTAQNLERFFKENLK
jgi:phosphocarrier protein HPr